MTGPWAHIDALKAQFEAERAKTETDCKNLGAAASPSIQSNGLWCIRFRNQFITGRTGAQLVERLAAAVES